MGWRRQQSFGPGQIGGTPTLNSFLISSDKLGGFLGGKGFFMSGPAYDASANTLMLFEVVFMETAGYIIVGAICERITFGAFSVGRNLHGGNSISNFWLLDLGRRLAVATGQTMGLGHGYCDFAGSTVVHGIGGWCAMALAIILGPRLGKYGKDGKPRAFPAH